MNDQPVPRWILPVIVVAQFFCTSLWFAGNAILPDIVKAFALGPGFLAAMTSAVQAGFITGTLIFAVLTISDRFSPSLVFFTCSIIAGLVNLGICLDGMHATALLLFRFSTGFFLAGIYPVGMKIASDYFQKGLGKSLGFLVGALVVGTAFPHFLKSMTAHFPWKYVVFTTSALSALGGLSMRFLVPDGPFRKAGQKLSFTAFMAGFKNKAFRSAAFGYFGHMWELYAFWAFVPAMLTANETYGHRTGLNVSLASFIIIASGGIACAVSGIISGRFGAKNVAAVSLLLSCFCCLLSPLFLFSHSAVALTAFLVFWGLVVVADSPLFSTLIAHNVPEELRGSSLTIVNCIGFSITIISIELINAWSKIFSAQYIYMLLAAGPALGLIALLKQEGRNI